MKITKEQIYKEGLKIFHRSLIKSSNKVHKDKSKVIYRKRKHKHKDYE